MVDFIDRKELFKILQKYYDIYPTHTDEFDVLCRVEDDIRNLPKADTERHAYWEVQYDCGEPCGAICSNCGSEIPYDRDGHFNTEESIFCSHCGAKMGGAEVEAKTDERNAVDKELMKSKIKTAMTKGTQYYDCEGNMAGYTSDVETESKTVRCINCGKRFPIEKIFKKETDFYV